MKLTFVAHSETGPVRKNNQDSGYASPRLLVVADGMGGAAAGDLASAVAIDEFERLAKRAERADGAEMLSQLGDVIARANDKIADLVADDPDLEGMGTTVSAYMFDDNRLALAHIGDSRAYLLRDGELRRTTHDHSWVQSLVDEGKITPEEANTHPHRNLLLKVLNGQPANEPDLELIDILVGDRLLICSDGLAGLTDDTAIANAMAQPDLSDVLSSLIELAHAGGGIDNITIVLADVDDDDDAGPPQEPVVLGAATERSIPEVSERTIAERVAAAEDDSRLLAEGEPADPEHERYAPTSAPGRRWLRIGIAILAVGIVLLIGILAGNAWVQSQYYVGVADGRVAIYQGLPDRVAGLNLSTVVEPTDTLVDDVPRVYRQRVIAGIRSSDLPAARNTVTELRTAAQICIDTRRPETPAPLDPTPSPAPPGPTGSPGGPTTAPATPTASLTPTPSPTPGPGGECG